MFTEGRAIQGRLHDTNLLLAAHSRRDSTLAYTAESQALLAAVARNGRLCHAFFWASEAPMLKARDSGR